MVNMEYGLEDSKNLEIDNMLISVTFLNDFVEISDPIIFKYLTIRFRLWDILEEKYSNLDIA